jgi:hypothetical protein
MIRSKTVFAVCASLLVTVKINAASPDAATRARIAEVANGPFQFEANRGQVNDAIRFLARGPGCQFFVSPNETVLQLNKVDAPSIAPHDLTSATTRRTTFSSQSVRLKFIGANPNAVVAGDGTLPGEINYLIGNDPAKWQTGVPTFQRVRVEALYPGINLIYYGNQHRMEYDLLVAPHVDPAAITFRFDGADKVSLNARGDLILQLGADEICQPKPVIYQTVNGVRKEIEGSYQFLKGQTYKFQIAKYDPALLLTIDPVLSYSTYFGGSGADIAWAVAVHTNGEIYMAGETLSANLPKGFGTNYNTYGGGNGLHGDAFIAKMNNFGTILYRTYVGGNTEDAAFAVAVDGDGDAYLAGYTRSANFPTANAISNTISGSIIPGLGVYPQDAFVAKLGPFGTNLLFSTYLGGSDVDMATGIALDGSGNVCVAGLTFSTNFPTRNAIQTNYAGNCDAFVLKIDPTGTNLLYSTFLGGTNKDQALDVAADLAGYVYVTGYTGSTNFPVTNALQSRLNGATNATTLFDAFITSVTPAGDAWSYSTFLGGAKNDYGFRLALDNLANVYVTGSTESTDFPGATTNMPSYLMKFGTGTDAFVAKVDPSGTNRLYTFVFGGNGVDIGWDVALDSLGQAHVIGETASTDFPVTNRAGLLRAVNSGGQDAFFAQLAAGGNYLMQSAYLGGSAADLGYGIDVDAIGNTYLVGETSSANFPSYFPAQPHSGGGKDAFLAKIVTEPTLHIGKSDTNVVLFWQANAGEFILQTKSDINDTNWFSGFFGGGVFPTPPATNGWHTIVFPPTGSNAYFRLFLP